MKVFLFTVIALCLPIVLMAAEPEKKNLLKPVNQVDSWRLEQTEPAAGTLAVADDGIKFTTTEVDGTSWHVQVFQIDLDLVEGKEYQLKFKAMSPESISYTAVAMIDQDDWHEIGLHEDLNGSKQFREESFSFTASQVAKMKNRIGFMLGGEKGSLVIKDMTLTEK